MVGRQTSFNRRPENYQTLHRIKIKSKKATGVRMHTLTVNNKVARNEKRLANKIKRKEKKQILKSQKMEIDNK